MVVEEQGRAARPSGREHTRDVTSAAGREQRPEALTVLMLTVTRGAEQLPTVPEKPPTQPGSGPGRSSHQTQTRGAGPTCVHRGQGRAQEVFPSQAHPSLRCHPLGETVSPARSGVEVHGSPVEGQSAKEAGCLLIHSQGEPSDRSQDWVCGAEYASI